MVATSKCPHCPSKGPFEIQEITTPQGKSAALVYCEACGAVVGAIIEIVVVAPEGITATIDTAPSVAAWLIPCFKKEELAREFLINKIEERLCDLVPDRGPEAPSKRGYVLSLAGKLALARPDIKNIDTAEAKLSDDELIRIWTFLKAVHHIP